MQRSSQLNTKALNRVNNSPGITPVWISTNQKIGDFDEEEDFDYDDDDDGDDEPKKKVINHHMCSCVRFRQTNV